MTLAHTPVVFENTDERAQGKLRPITLDVEEPSSAHHKFDSVDSKVGRTVPSMTVMTGDQWGMEGHDSDTDPSPSPTSPDTDDDRMPRGFIPRGPPADPDSGPKGKTPHSTLRKKKALNDSTGSTENDEHATDKSPHKSRDVTDRPQVEGSARKRTKGTVDGYLDRYLEPMAR
ncbi:hypothetical protein EW146_g9142 [Bondarzewia mesenterica]|uniref:Uncharacterized protein n=1 Tax=Bondarzewia mesenterica TaxID=1095465 RepID=A0A4S4L943_9AGAM|nr:hypothetical protein EW146_g9142 [Bondarzewia mesenterica]